MRGLWEWAEAALFVAVIIAIPWLMGYVALALGVR